MFKFDLQVFAEESGDEAVVEIPAELEGISPEVAAEIMKELPPNESAPEEADETQEQELSGEESAEPENQPETETKEEPALEEKKPPTSIPYERFKEVNEKQKAASEEVVRLKAELAKQAQQQVLPQEYKEQSNQEDTPLHLTPTFVNMVRNEARDRAKIATGFTDEQISVFESEYADNSPEKQRWAESIQSLIPLVAIEAKELVKQQEVQEAQQRRVYQLVHDEYGQLAEAVKSWTDKEAVWNHVSGAYFAALPESEQIALNSAYMNAESGRGSMQDVQYVKYHLNRAATDYRSTQQKAEMPPQETKPKQNKIEQMKAHPKVDQISGSQNPGEITAADLERMINTTPWDKIPPEYQKILLDQ